ncbi:MAG TPA: DUF6265 family protein [Usitatibacteraceae bacterium]|nr:DUF6265 family protein [Usitatibacteraceae bacterium]
MRIAPLLVAFAYVLPAFAQDPPAPAAPTKADTRPAPPPARLADAAWLQGYWVGEGLGGDVEDVWMPPKAGVMLGAFRLHKKEGKGFYELFAIEEEGESLVFIVKHFNPDWVGWEEKDKALRLRLSRVAPGTLAFGGVVFEKQGDDGLVVKLAIRQKDGRLDHHTLTYRRKAL